MKLTGVELIYMLGSPPCRAVLMCLKELKIEVDMKKIDMFHKAEHKQPWFVKMNPQHCVPTLNDNGFILWESRAIIAYLISKYGSEEDQERLLPSDPQARARTDKMLYFDNGCLYKSIADYYARNIFRSNFDLKMFPGMETKLLSPKDKRRGGTPEALQIHKDIVVELFWVQRMLPQLMSGAPTDHQKANALKQNLDYLDIFLEDSPYVAGDSYTAADLSILASVTHLESVEFRYEGYTHIAAWAKKMKAELPYYNACNKEGVEMFLKWARSRMAVKKGK